MKYLSEVFDKQVDFLFRNVILLGLASVLCAESLRDDGVWVATIAVTTTWEDLFVAVACVISALKTTFAEDSCLVGYAVKTSVN